ncbi:extracellular catalytic domain type 1 short-chain-length polyhydroxyalkanoate depolymerase [Pararhizobium sp.]|uniref:extracellular catalytic domain type 1 short-chain-length polyhydroxyalkanoate depolymerase n=1 Tax=Pararhizobium sp. TaxID=1977563 RepID=UPI00271E973A|nr:PHB depolymerase family esterase [Pararhizobium sp.]MDO9418486.1 PHB depolymerase family esterase [Pararhizobium sp.]
MRSMADTIERLARFRMKQSVSPQSARLRRLDFFGSNPGELSGWCHVPADVPKSPALVVVLHGCTQTAAGYDAGSGWSKLADDYGFAVLFPEQARANNANLCFNWFNPEDRRRDGGETLSIRQMIAAMVSAHHIDERRIYVTGLSAGGAMANTMLASYPDLFAGGAILAGLPHDVAATVPEAFDRMRGHGLPSAEILQARLKRSSMHDGPWPPISVWHGTSDQTVVIANATAIVEQWRGVHGAGVKATAIETVHGHQRSIWHDRAGAEAIVLYQLSGMAHGTPIDVASGYGAAAPFMLDVGLSSTLEIARRWGLAASFERRETPTADRPAETAHPAAPSETPDTITSVIERALRSAGLMR